MEGSEGKSGIEQTGSQYKKGGKSKNWIQKAVNPAHKGYCTPMSKPTCTPRRKALARTFKKMAKKEDGGIVDPLKQKDALYSTTKMSEKSKISKQALGGVLEIIANFKKGGQMDKTPKEVNKRINIPYKKDKVSNLVKTAKVKTGGNLPTKHKFGGSINFDISNIISKWKK